EPTRFYRVDMYRIAIMGQAGEEVLVCLGEDLRPDLTAEDTFGGHGSPSGLVVERDPALCRLDQGASNIFRSGGEDRYVVEVPILKTLPIHDVTQFPDVEAPHRTAPRQMHGELLVAVDDGDGQGGIVAHGHGEVFTEDALDMMNLRENLELLADADDPR